MPRFVWDDIIGQPRESRATCGSGRRRPRRARLSVRRAARRWQEDGGSRVCLRAVLRRRRLRNLRRLRPREARDPSGCPRLQPEGAAGYLAEQVREIIHDVSLSPIEGPLKVYIMEGADLFNDSAANALLKTLEEPPADVVFVLLAHSLEPVPPTIVSRCQVVRFRRLAPSEAVALLLSQTGAAPDEAAAALAAAGGVVARARDFSRSPHGAKRGRASCGPSRTSRPWMSSTC